ncbi:MAG: DUF1778 domain-containing protein [Prolixibacteraceae bacterium]
MNANNTDNEMTRFDARLSKRQKLYFEKAATLGGYRNLTDFIFATAQEKAREIIQEKETVLASQKDSEIFFDALMNPEKPNDALTAAAENYRKLMSE